MAPSFYVLALLAGLGCGRVAFDPLAAATGDAADDATDPMRAGPCLRNPALGPGVMLGGKTFQYTDFNNNTMGLASVAVDVLAEDLATSLATTTSNVNGSYTLAIPLEGEPRSAVIVYSRGSFWTTRVSSDRPFDRDVIGPDMTHWRLGDGPLWNDGSMGSVYSTLGATTDLTKGFLSVNARDCAGEVIEGVSFEVTPPPATAGYLGADGLPQPGATSTLAPNAQFVAFNVEPGPTHIRASKAGLQFLDLELIVLSGRNVTYTLVHAFD